MDLAKIRGAMQGSYPVRIEPYTLYGQSPPQGLEISFFFQILKERGGGISYRECIKGKYLSFTFHHIRT